MLKKVTLALLLIAGAAAAAADDPVPQCFPCAVRK
jgi:hypothetical protein